MASSTSSSSIGETREEPVRWFRDTYCGNYGKKLGHPSSYKNCDEMLHTVHGETKGSTADNSSFCNQSPTPDEKFDTINHWVSSSSKFNLSYEPHDGGELDSRENSCDDYDNGNYPAYHHEQVIPNHAGGFDGTFGRSDMAGNLKRKRETREENDCRSRKQPAFQQSIISEYKRDPGHPEYKTEPEYDEISSDDDTLLIMETGSTRAESNTLESEITDSNVGNGGGIPLDTCAGFPATISQTPRPESNSLPATHGMHIELNKRKLEMRKSRFGSQLDDSQLTLDVDASNDVNLTLDEVVDKRNLSYRKKRFQGRGQWDAPNAHYGDDE